MTNNFLTPGIHDLGTGGFSVESKLERLCQWGYLAGQTVGVIGFLVYQGSVYPEPALASLALTLSATVGDYLTDRVMVNRQSNGTVQKPELL